MNCWDTVRVLSPLGGLDFGAPKSGSSAVALHAMRSLQAAPFGNRTCCPAMHALCSGQRRGRLVHACVYNYQGASGWSRRDGMQVQICQCCAGSLLARLLDTDSKTHVLNVEIEEPQGPIQKAYVGCVVLPWRRVRPRVHESLVCVTMLKEIVKYRAETTEEDMDARLPPKRKDESTLK